jgi:hypothetical protein
MKVSMIKAATLQPPKGMFLFPRFPVCHNPNIFEIHAD